MPHLLSINNYHYRRGGSDVVFLEHDAMFRAAGWQTAVMAMHHPSNLPSPWSDHFVDELEFGGDYPLASKLVMAAKVVWSWEARRKLSALLDRFPARVAHLHCIYHHLSPSILPVLKDRGVTTVMTAHDLKLACPAYKMLNQSGVCERCKGGNLGHVLRHKCIHGSTAASALVMVESATHRALGVYARHLDRVVAPSQFYREKLLQWGWRPSQVVYIPNFVGLDAAIGAAPLPMPAPDAPLVYFGRISEEKGLVTLVKAALAARVRLDIIGDGPLRPALEPMLAGQQQVVLRGRLGGAALWQAVQAARAAVIPSEWYENAPMSVLEAHALGRPVIGADIGGIPELIAPGETGWLFPPGDVQALADRLSQVASMPSGPLLAMGEQARERVLRHFSRARYQQAMTDLYASLGVPAPEATAAPL